jgi:hypothetical protein
MLWYGFYLHKIMFYLKHKTKKHKFTNKYRNNAQFFFYNLNIAVPSTTNAVLVKKTNTYIKIFYIYSPIYYFILSVPSTVTYINVDKNTFVINLQTNTYHNYINLYWTLMNRIFITFYRPLFLKLRFRGKGYYIYKNKRNTITPQFGYAHRLFFYNYLNLVKFLSKISLIFLG